MKGLAIITLLVSLLIQEIYAAELYTISNSQFLTDGDTLVSAAGIFELGFFKPAGSSENRYLGIWYKKISIQTVVWVANRNHPITSATSNMLKISDTGILILLNNISDIIWSSNSTSSRNPTAKLLDNGNLVVMEDTLESVLWQSFDSLTDTLIPGMKFGRNFLTGKEWFLSSWKSDEDPGIGEFSWILDSSSYPQSLLKQGEVVKYRGPWRGKLTSRDSLFIPNASFSYDNEMVVTYSSNLGNSSVLWRFTLTSSGSVDYSVWIENDNKWQTILAFPQDICDTYNICNSFASCSIMNSQACVCLDEKRFVPRNQKGWEMADWSGGCVRRTPLDCSNGTDGFIRYPKIKLPDTKSSWFNLSMTKKECEEKCLRNCSCMAYANTALRFEGHGCLLWFNDLRDLRGVSESTGDQDIFVRMASSELVSEKKGGAKVKFILLVLILVVLVISTWFFCARIKRVYAKPKRGGGLLNVDKQEDAMYLPLFSFPTISNATFKFSPDNKLGEGGFGSVYKGVLEEGIEIAVKRLSKTSNQGVDEFKNEVICISKLQHRNLVKLLGCCIHGDEKLLIYEFMPNGNLASFIFDKNRGMLLDWKKRFDIIKGIARGLLYLHQDSRLRIIHRDLKASNILLDLNMNPKISDFGLARCFGGNETQANTQRVVGTYGYMSPEYALNGIFSTKSDVFSFGVLVMEIVSGKRNRVFIHGEQNNNLIGHAWSVYNEGRSMELIDAILAESCNPSEVLRSIGVGLLCVQQNPGDRPHMSSVIQLLGGEGELPQPKQPPFFMEKELPVAELPSSPHAAGSVNGLTITELDAR